VAETVITAGQRSFHDRGLLTGEPVGVLLVAVGHDLQVREPGRAGGGGAHIRAGLRLLVRRSLPASGWLGDLVRAAHQLGDATAGNAQNRGRIGDRQP
jgi:hypothetical protein